MKHIALLILLLLPCALFAQYPNNPNKIRLGFQTTGNGLIYRGSGAPTQFPTGYNSPFQQYDTVANILWVYQDSFWYATNTVRRSTPPPYSSTSSGLTLVYGHATWQDSDDEQRYEYVANDSIEAWVPAVGIYYATSAPADIAATPTTGAVEYTAALWNKVPTDSLFRHDGANWVFIGKSGPHFVRGDSGALQDIAEGDTLTITGGYGVNVVTAAGDTVTVIVDTTQIATQYDLSQISTSFVVDADAGTPQTIASGDTLQINSGWGVNTTVGATGLITVTGDSTQVATQFDISAHVSGPLTSGRIPRATGTYTLSDGVLRDDGTLLALGGVTVSGYSFYDYSTGGWRLATGTTAQRPTNAAGVKRYNTSLGYSETANGSAWLQSDFPIGTSAQTLRNNGTSWIANSNIWNDGSSIQLGGTTTNNYVGVGVVPTGTNALMHIRGPNNQGINRSRLLIGNTTAPALHATGNDQICASLTVYADWETDTKAPPVFSGGGQTGIYTAASQWVQASSQAILGYNSINSASFTFNQFSQGWAGYFLNRNASSTGKMTDGLNSSNRRDWYFYGVQGISSQSGLTVTANNLGISPNTYTWGGKFDTSAPANSADAGANNSSWGVQASNSGGKAGYGIQAVSLSATTNFGGFFSAASGTYNWGVYSSAGLNGFAGNVLINSAISTTSSAAQTLHVEGTARITSSDGTATALMGRDADGDISAVSEGYGINITGGALEVDTTQIATQSDLAAINPTTLYTGDGTIATDRTVTLDDEISLQIDGAVASDGAAFYQRQGLVTSYQYGAMYGFIQYFENSDAILEVSAGKDVSTGDVRYLTSVEGDGYAEIYVDDKGTVGFYSNDSGGASYVHANSDATDSHVEIIGGDYVSVAAGGASGYTAFDINSVEEFRVNATGIGINDTSPEKSLDVGGMGKFRQLSGQDNSVTIGTNANAGTGRSASITDAQSSDVAGRFSFTSGTTLTAGEWVTLTWGSSFDNAPAVQLFPENANGASIVPYLYVVPSTTGCSIVVNVTGIPYEGLTYEFNYIVIQGK